MGVSDHMTINIDISCKPILVQCPPRESYENTKWKQYTDDLSGVLLINLGDAFLGDVEK